MPLQMKLVELRIVKDAKSGCQSSQCTNEPELRTDDVGDETEPHLLSKRKAMLGFTLQLDQRIACRKNVRIQIGAADTHKIKVADLVCGIECPTQQIAGSLKMHPPGKDVNRKVIVSSGLKVLQIALFDEVITEAAEPVSGLEVT